MSGKMVEVEGIIIERNSQSSVRLEAAGTVVYIDPYQISEARKDANLILITHDHYDHCDPESVDKLKSENTVVIFPESCASKMQGKTIKPGEVMNVNGISVIAVNAYNTARFYGHKKGQCVGYVVSIGGKKIYHAGDTDRIPEMKQLGDISMAFLPVGGTYTMTAEEAAAAVNEDIRPEIAIPMHYGTVVGSDEDANKFKQLCNSKVVII